MTTDPFNETWLNSFMDSLVPPSLTPSNDPSGPASISNFNSGINENDGQVSMQLPFEPGPGMDFLNQQP